MEGIIPGFIEARDIKFRLEACGDDKMIVLYISAIFKNN